MHPVLTSLRQRPGLYFGGPDLPFTRLEAFLAGFQIGRICGQDQSQPQLEDFLPQNFTLFVTEHYGREYPDGGRGWQALIREHTTSEDQAFRVYFDLLSQYETQQKTG